LSTDIYFMSTVVYSLTSAMSKARMISKKTKDKRNKTQEGRSEV
jgi:hypothetical protein